ncbi:MAG: class IV adenylate cyclase [Pseudonocardiaceae bacterium]
MGIQAEVKARVRDPGRVRELLRQRAQEEVAVYSDTYFDTPDRSLTNDGRELRVRVVHTDTAVTTVLTYKGAVVDEASGSKQEIETVAANADALRAILAGLGFAVLIEFDKHCSNYRFTANHSTLLATLVRVAELDQTYLEIESIVDTGEEVGSVLATIRAVPGELGIERTDETTETYTDAVAARRP